MKNSVRYRLITIGEDSVYVFDHVNQLCEHIVNEKIDQYYVIETVTKHEKMDISRELSIYKHKLKEKADAAKAAGKPDIETKAEPVQIQGEVVATKPRPKLKH